MGEKQAAHIGGQTGCPLWRDFAARKAFKKSTHIFSKFDMIINDIFIQTWALALYLVYDKCKEIL